MVADIYCEDNEVGADVDRWNSLIIRSFNLTFTYEKKINQNKLETYVVQWIDGKLEMIWPKDLAQTKYVYPVDWIKERE